MNRGRRRKVVLFGHFGMGNFGNESTLQAVLYHLNRFVPDAEVNCISSGPESTERTHRIEAIPIAETFLQCWMPRNAIFRYMRKACIGIPSELYRWVSGLMTLRRTDVLIIPGTGLITDAYGLLSWGPYNLFRWSLSAKLCRCKILFVSVGAGPLYSVLGKCLAKAALGLADFRSYRDKSSKQYLKAIGCKTNGDGVYPDLVFSLPEVLIPQRVTREGGRSVVGLGLMHYPERYSVPNPSPGTYWAYLNNLVSVVAWVLARNYDVRLLIGDLWDTSSILEFKVLLRARLANYDERRIIDEPISSVDNLISQIADTDMVVVTRFHNIVLALLSNKPVISISFHHKCHSLMSAIGLSDYCLDINEFSADKLIEKLLGLENNASQVKSLIKEMVGEYRRALEEQYKCIFNDI